MEKSYLESNPDKSGFFGEYGGSYMNPKDIDFVVERYPIPKGIK
jgi:hypothetical protein